jgi:8-oxo-dGTP diphosphatase
VSGDTGSDASARGRYAHQPLESNVDGGATPHFVYVLALLFTPDACRVVLVRKKRPAWQAGRVNALGGKVLPGESAAEAASREVREEAVARVPVEAWRELVVWRDPVYRMHVLSAFHAAADRARTAEDQEVFLADADDLPKECIENLRWLVPLALDRDVALPIQVRSANPEGSGLTEPVPE